MVVVAACMIVKSVRGMGLEISQWRKEQNIGARKIALSREKAS